MSDEDWKRRIIDQDIAGFARRAQKAGKVVTVYRNEGGKIVQVEVRDHQTHEEKDRVWAELAPRLTPDQILPGLRQVLQTHGKSAVLGSILALKEYRPDLLSTIDAAVKALGLARESRRAELQYLNRMWTEEVGPNLREEHLAPMLAVVQAKGPDVAAAWIRRIRKHRPDLVPTLKALLLGSPASAINESEPLSRTTDANYIVNGRGFTLFSDAVGFASSVGAAEVYGVREQRRVWHPASQAKPKTRHVIVKPDGSETEFRRVKRGH